MEVFTPGKLITVLVRLDDDTECIKLRAFVCEHNAHVLRLLLYRPKTNSQSFAGATYLLVTKDEARIQVDHTPQVLGHAWDLLPENLTAVQRLIPFHIELSPLVTHVNYAEARAAALTFLLIAPELPLHKDIVPRIARLVYEPEMREIRFKNSR